GVRGEQSARARRDLLEVYGLFASEYDYRPVDRADVPLGDFAREYHHGHGKRVLHSYGAIQCLERLLDMVHDQGIILLADYGPTQPGGAEDFEHQRFSQATFVGVNFPELAAYFGGEGRGRWLDPGDEGAGIHARLLGR